VTWEGVFPAVTTNPMMTPAFQLDTHVKLVQYIKLAEHVVYGAPEWTRAPRFPLIGNERERVLHVIHQTIEKLSAWSRKAA
jgi:4-hydroxy-tetrahydrodipicolinate synthase